MCTSFKQDLMNGLHAFGTSVVRGTTTPDTFKAALYLSTASLGAATTAYSATGEVSGTGYTAGGVNVTFGTAPATSNGTAYVTPSASIVFSGVTLSTAFDAVLIYNNTATGKNAVSVHTFGSQIVTAGTFTLTMPTNNDTTGLIRLS
jgi:hypothetical protein